MNSSKKSKAKIGNRLLAALPDNECRRMQPKLDEVVFKYGEIICGEGAIIGDVYFPNSGIISLLANAATGAPLEVGFIGNEGIVGLPVFLGVKTANNRAVVHGSGSAMKMKTTDFLEECNLGGALPKILRRFTHSMLAQISQSAICFRLHPLKARLARWLLMTSDRMESNDFQMTQEFLANMLGVRREAVSKSAAVLQNQKIIEYNRGQMRILARANLEKTSCPCYAVTKAEEQSFPIE